MGVLQDHLVLSTGLTPQSDSKADVSSVSPSSERIQADEGLTLETSAFESRYGGQFALSIQLIKPNYYLEISSCYTLSGFGIPNPRQASASDAGLIEICCFPYTVSERYYC